MSLNFYVDMNMNMNMNMNMYMNMNVNMYMNVNFNMIAVMVVILHRRPQAQSNKFKETFNKTNYLFFN